MQLNVGHAYSTFIDPQSTAFKQSSSDLPFRALLAARLFGPRRLPRRSAVFELLYGELDVRPPFEVRDCLEELALQARVGLEKV